MHKDGQWCMDLIKLTANSLSGGIVALMLVAVQKDNLEVSINCAIKLSRPTTVYCSSDATMTYLRWR